MTSQQSFKIFPELLEKHYRLFPPICILWCVCASYLRLWVAQWNNGVTSVWTGAQCRPRLEENTPLNCCAHIILTQLLSFLFLWRERARLQASCSHPSWPSKPPPCAPIGLSRVWTKLCVLAHLLIIKGSAQAVDFNQVSYTHACTPLGYILLTVHLASMVYWTHTQSRSQTTHSHHSCTWSQAIGNWNHFEKLPRLCRRAPRMLVCGLVSFFLSEIFGAQFASHTWNLRLELYKTM